MKRADALLKLRPEIHQSKTDGLMSPEEFFQNDTLRPILKLQNELLLGLFNAYIARHKGVFNDLTIGHKMNYIDGALQKDIALKNVLKGVVIGQMTLDELEVYGLDSGAYNRRIIGMIKERLKSQIQLLGQG